MAENYHASLTGADLHEPKGVASASDNAIAQASSNSVAWSTEINPSKITLSNTAWANIPVSVNTTSIGVANDPDFAQLQDDGSTSVGVFAYLFDPSTREEVFFDVILPHSYKEGTDIDPHIHWCPTSTNTGSVVWGLEYTTHSNGDTIPTTTTITVTDAADGTSLKHQIAEFAAIDGTSLIESSIISCRLFRDAANGSDTYTGDAAGIVIDFNIEVEKLGSDEEYPGV